MRAVLFFGGACFAVFVIAAAASIYGFGQYEHAWGRGGSLQVEAWLGLVGALVAMGSFGIASVALHRIHTQESALVLGVACATVYIFLCWIVSSLMSSAGVFVAFALLIVLCALASLAGRSDAR